MLLFSSMCNSTGSLFMENHACFVLSSCLCVCCAVNVHGIDALDYDVESAAVARDDVADTKAASLARLGVHTVDELDTGIHGADSGLRLQYESDYDSLHSSSRVTSPGAAAAPLRSILSLTPRSLTPKSSRSRVRLMEGLTEVRSRSPSPVFTTRSRSRTPSPVSTARSHSVTSIPDEEILTGRSAASVQTAATESESTTRSSNNEQVTVASTGEVTAHAVSHSETARSSHRRASRRRSSDLVSVSSSRRIRRASETATVLSYSEDFTSSRTSVDYSEQTSSVSDVTKRQRRHRKHSSPSHTSHRCALTFVLPGVPMATLLHFGISVNCISQVCALSFHHHQ